MNECDPKKCTALKLARHGVVRLVRRIPTRAVVLNPFSEVAFSPADRGVVERWGLVVVDCSWKNADSVFRKIRHGRCLPFLIAANPINYGHVGKLSSAEALAAALYIIGYREEAKRVLSLFKWGPHFFELNREYLEAYANASSSEEVVGVQKRLMGLMGYSL